MLDSPTKAELQEQQYVFPYHHIPHFEASGAVSLTRRLTWGLRYLCYQLHIRQLVVDLAPSSVLEVGCGDGFFLGNLPRHIARRLGVDLSTRAIAFARAFYPDCDFEVVDAADVPECFDVVAAIEVLEHVPEKSVSRFIRTLEARTREDGAVVLSVPTTVMPLTPKHHRHYDLALLEAQLARSGAKLTIERVEYIFSKPWWFDWFKWLLNNRLFRLEIKPLTRIAWERVWSRHRRAAEATGCQMVVLLRRSTQ